MAHRIDMNHIHATGVGREIENNGSTIPFQLCATFPASPSRAGTSPIAIPRLARPGRRSWLEYVCDSVNDDMPYELRTKPVRFMQCRMHTRSATCRCFTSINTSPHIRRAAEGPLRVLYREATTYGGRILALSLRHGSPVCHIAFPQSSRRSMSCFDAGECGQPREPRFAVLAQSAIGPLGDGMLCVNGQWVRDTHRIPFRDPMKLPTHNRYDYVPINRRKDYTSPGGKRLAVYFCNNIEYFAFGTGLGSDSTGGTSATDAARLCSRRTTTPSRVGIWRMFDLFDEVNVPLAGDLNSMIFDHRPAVGGRHDAARRMSSSLTDGFEDRASERPCRRRRRRPPYRRDDEGNRAAF